MQSDRKEPERIRPPDDRWEFPPRVEKKLAQVMPDDDAQLHALVCRLQDGELWLAAAIERYLKGKDLFSQAALDQWATQGFRIHDGRLDKAALLLQKPPSVFGDAERARYLFDRCCEQFLAYSTLERAFLVQRRYPPLALIRRIVDADWMDAPPGKALHVQAVRALDFYRPLLTMDENKQLDRLQAALDDDAPAVEEGWKPENE
jgi:hypothetical protein